MKLKKLFSGEGRELKKLEKQAEQIMMLESVYASKSDEELKEQTEAFRTVLKEGNSLDSILNDAYAVVREMAKRKLGLSAYKEQLMGAIALHHGDIAEMATGSGKTLTGIFPAYLNALEGKGVYVIMPNDYLAERDATNNGKVLTALGLTVGFNRPDSGYAYKQEQYKKDILYTTDSELGFDYLRDNMAYRADNVVMRDTLNYALIDEVDAILIDDAKTPLIISGNAREEADTYTSADRFVKGLSEDKDYKINYEDNQISLTPEGIKKAEKTFHTDNLMDRKNRDIYHRIMQALKANYLFFSDKDYMVVNNPNGSDIAIIDANTGRVMENRTYSYGLHQAIEAKEGVPITDETSIQASITYQNLFRLFYKLSGMTGTAKTEEEEFMMTYNMKVVCIPTHQKNIREDGIDLVFATKKAKYNAIIKDVISRHEKGQPVLLGTASVDVSELLSKMLTEKGVPHSVLNAKNHAREAEIIARAGEKGRVTIATNMAGRGTDIKLGEGVKELGGLAVIGSERHEARRIDNQLRGRAGRQGDPGCTQFYLSLEDDLVKRLGIGMLSSYVEGVTDDKPLRSKMLNSVMESAQKKMEGISYDQRTEELKYDEFTHMQRTVFYNYRKAIFTADNADTLSKAYRRMGVEESAIASFMQEAKKKQEAGTLDSFMERMKMGSLYLMDEEWKKQLMDMAVLKNGIGLRSYAQYNPLDEFSKTGYELFMDMKERMNASLSRLLKAEENTEDVKASLNVSDERNVKVA